jgi:hypothetical protein
MLDRPTPERPDRFWNEPPTPFKGLTSNFPDIGAGMQRVAVVFLPLWLLAAGQQAALAMGAGGAGGAGAGHGSHGTVKPGGGGGSYNLPSGLRAHVPATPPAMLEKRKKSPRS